MYATVEPRHLILVSTTPSLESLTVLLEDTNAFFVPYHDKLVDSATLLADCYGCLGIISLGGTYSKMS